MNFNEYCKCGNHILTDSPCGECAEEEVTVCIICGEVEPCPCDSFDAYFYNQTMRQAAIDFAGDDMGMVR